MGCGCYPKRGLERIDGINFREYLANKHLKQGRAEKSFLVREVLGLTGKGFESFCWSLD
jgi:hypothetical protein